MIRLARAAAAALLVLGLVPGAAGAASATFGTPTARATFGTEVSFTQRFDSPVPLARVEVLLTFPEALGPYVAEAAGATPAGSRQMTYRWSLAKDGHIVPNTPITARWRLVPADPALPSIEGPPATILYADTRFSWRTVEGKVVRLHWYEGSDAFGRRALAIGERAVEDAAAFLGVTETAPIDFYVYAAQAPFYDALGPGTRENVGGEAHADIRTMFALISPAAVTDPWVGIVIPHELTHLVFDTAVRNPYHAPPRWLNEGVAVYLSEGYTASDRGATDAAAAAGRLMPLQALEGQFPTSAERFSLAYSESSSAIDFLVRTAGTPALVKLIRSYAGGVTDDEAFRAATGKDVAGFEAAWLADLGAAAPERRGPQPAPAGPLPPGWDGTTVPGASSPAPVASASAPVASASPAPGSAAAGSIVGEGWFLALVALAGLAVGGGIAWALRRRSTSPPGPGPAAPGGDPPAGTLP
ncbi:MAG: peptidase MA family metallohydrolase [Chloroflexi bacterium]|nr:peptidase MA family metallohydrolase [Chloroflexota bacterium]